MADSWQYFLIVLAAAVVLDIILIRYLKIRRISFNLHYRNSENSLTKPFFTKNWKAGYEIVILAAAALIFSFPFLNFDPTIFISGGEFTFPIISHYVWKLLPQCGSCFLWNGYFNGGYPTFVELHGAFLHPFVIITSIFFGVINGSKMIAVCSFFMAGLGQWWLSKELNLGFWPRIWAGLLAITGGHLFGRLASGNIVLVFSIASASFILPMLLRLKKKPTNQNMVLLTLIFVLTWLSGQGYVQFIVILIYIPVFLFYLRKNKTAIMQLIRSVLVSFLMISVLIVPLLHFQSNWDKNDDPAFSDVQPVGYQILNLVIDDVEFFKMETLNKNPIPYLHINFIGWVPLLLTVTGLFFIREDKRKQKIWLLFILMGLIFIFTGREFYALFGEFKPFTQLRSINIAASLAIQPLLGIAAFSFDRILQTQNFNLDLEINRQNTRTKLFSFRLLFILLIFSLSIIPTVQFSSHFIKTRQMIMPEIELQYAHTASTQWITPINHDRTPTLVQYNQKTLIQDRPWFWKDRPQVLPYLEFKHNPEKLNFEDAIFQEDELVIFSNPDQVYAAVQTTEESYPCQANALGGHIDINCSTPEKGILTVKEYYWTGWRVWLDGNPAHISPGNWLNTSLPAGEHQISFRYRPWDVYVGLIGSLAGIALCIYLWQKPDDVSGSQM